MTTAYPVRRDSHVLKDVGADEEAEVVLERVERRVQGPPHGRIGHVRECGKVQLRTTGATESRDVLATRDTAVDSYDVSSMMHVIESRDVLLTRENSDPQRDLRECMQSHDRKLCSCPRRDWLTPGGRRLQRRRESTQRACLMRVRLCSLWCTHAVHSRPSAIKQGRTPFAQQWAVRIQLYPSLEPHPSRKPNPDPRP